MQTVYWYLASILMKIHNSVNIWVLLSEFQIANRLSNLTL